MKKLNNKGFSLVELIIVIAIMAVLIGVLAPQFIKYVESSRESTDLQNITEVKTAVEAFVADSESSATTVTVTLSHTTGTAMTITGVAASDLSGYGVEPANIKTKAKDWSGDIVWKYENYKWTTTVVNGKAYKSDGSKAS
ncbi:MAG: prepilin-type N-terminal cleavage/methylation domain-containing protein [Lachnospiraceae bacterium]|nr:prepilin-type N-terminal cleavage/methylation domain-containing protein [Candidatus Colinaster equi]